MPKSDESSSDLERAREISQRLADPDRRAGAKVSEPTHRFSADHARAVAGLPAQPAPVGAAVAAAAARSATPPPRSLPPLPTGGGWEALVGWCRAALPADAAFLIDDHGLLVALSGELDPREAEGVGGRLVHILEQADEVKGGAKAARSVTLEFAGSCLGGWRVLIGPGVFLTLGAVSARPPGPDASAVVARAFSGKRPAA